MQVNIREQIGQGIGFFAAFALALFVPAGTVAWPAGWIFLILFFGFYAALQLWLARHNPALLQERSRLWRADQQGWDKWLFPFVLLLPFAWLAFIALDVMRFHWSLLPVWLQWVGALVLMGSFYLLFLTFRENTYLSTVVRIQKEREHTVIATGPYHCVRHPMYSAILIFGLGTALLLGSGYGLLLGALYTFVLARRAVLEERTLQAELRGYAAYITQVPYRFAPYIW
ncbi:MAG: isoprenylcysteine carboxylmethyltransferase family protein [Caldilineaceae bacterium]